MLRLSEKGATDVSSSSLNVSDNEIVYLKPWHPPDSTVIRKARLALESLSCISLRRCECR